MANQTLVEKILSQKVGREVLEGDEVLVEPDVVMSHDSTTPPAIKAYKEWNCPEKVRFPNRIVIPFDHASPLNQIEDRDIRAKAEEYHAAIIAFAKEQGITNIFDQGDLGICHQVLPELGFVTPGSVIIGGDSHTCTYGAFASFAYGVGSRDIAAAWATGQELIEEVPPTYAIHVEGKFIPGVYAKDLALHVCGQLGIDGATGLILEYRGQTVEQMSMDERMTAANMAVEVGATTALFASDQTTIDWLTPRTDKPLIELAGDNDNEEEYAGHLYVDANDLLPQVAKPHSPDNVVDISDIEGLEVDKVFIGTCTNSRLSDWEAAWRTLVGHKVQVPTLMTPASKEVWEAAQQARYVADLEQAGVQFEDPGCSACLGRRKVFPAPGETVVSTMNRNFKGRMGAKDTQIYLVSPASAAMTARYGKLMGAIC